MSYGRAMEPLGSQHTVPHPLPWSTLRSTRWVIEEGDSCAYLRAVGRSSASAQGGDGASPQGPNSSSSTPSTRAVHQRWIPRRAHSQRTPYKLDMAVVRQSSAEEILSNFQLSLFADGPRPFPILPHRWMVERTPGLSAIDSIPKTTTAFATSPHPRLGPQRPTSFRDGYQPSNVSIL